MKYALTIAVTISIAVFTGLLLADAASEQPQIKKDIIERCRSSLDSYGAATVKFCVDEDIKAFNQLSAYPKQWSNIVNRCKGQVLSIGGWSTVKFCADQDIAAEKELNEM